MGLGMVSDVNIYQINVLQSAVAILVVVGIQNQSTNGLVVNRSLPARDGYVSRRNSISNLLRRRNFMVAGRYVNN